MRWGCSSSLLARSLFAGWLENLSQIVGLVSPPTVLSMEGLDSWFPAGEMVAHPLSSLCSCNLCFRVSEVVGDSMVWVQSETCILQGPINVMGFCNFFLM